MFSATVQRLLAQRPVRLSCYVLACLALTATLRVLSDATPIVVGFLLAQLALISILIWQACDPFAGAAQWIGHALKLPGSIRGATLDAIASSMPELFSGLFFVWFVFQRAGTSDMVQACAAEGYGASIATCAGSAVYNMILIPAICAIFISYYRQDRPTVRLEERVLARDGVWFVYCELLLIMFLFRPALEWWMAVVLLGMYFVYTLILVRDAQAFRRNAVLEDHGAVETHVGVLFDSVQLRLNARTAWGVIGVCTGIAAVGCYWLVEVTWAAAEALNVPLFFMAVILAAAASSLPDTLLSVGAAKRGDDSGAISNAFGSNIFDLCVCLTAPLLLASYLNGWQPIQIAGIAGTGPGIVVLRLLLCALTIVTLALMWHRRELNRTKAFALCGLYGVFIAFAVVGSMGII